MKNKEIKKVVVITGASSGIGLACAKLFIKKGLTVYNLSRSEPVEEINATFIKMDVTVVEQVKSAINQIIEKENRIDILINNAGFGISGSCESTDIEQVKKIFDVNFNGVVNVTNAALPKMREQKFGTVVNISSLGAIFPLPFQAFYSATKNAVVTYSRALRTELKPFNTKITCILPGDIKTGFTKAREKNKNELDCYREKAEKSVAKMEHSEQTGKSPEYIAKIIVKTALKKNPKPMVAGGFSNALLAFLTRILPTRCIDFLVSKLY